MPKPTASDLNTPLIPSSTSSETRRTTSTRQLTAKNPDRLSIPCNIHTACTDTKAGKQVPKVLELRVIFLSVVAEDA